MQNKRGIENRKGLKFYIYSKIALLNITFRMVALYMRFQTGILYERLPTQVASVPPIIRMGPYMILQRLESRIAFITVLASEIPFTSVRSHMLFQTRRQIEALITILTLMLEDLLMIPPLMFSQSFLPIINFITQIAWVRSLLAVRFCQMLVLQRVRHEALVAARAPYYSFLLVHYIHMHVFIVIRFEYLTANFAGVTLVVLMPFQMSVETWFLQETHTAHVTRKIAEMFHHMGVKSVEVFEHITTHNTHQIIPSKFVQQHLIRSFEVYLLSMYLIYMLLEGA